GRITAWVAFLTNPAAAARGIARPSRKMGGAAPALVPSSSRQRVLLAVRYRRPFFRARRAWMRAS
ncbi:MAG: hypothetical protein ACRD01_02380, partial [Terriglobales bacterium]